MPEKRVEKLQVHPVVRSIREKLPEHQDVIALDGYVGVSDPSTTRLYRSLALDMYFEFSTGEIIESMDLGQPDGAVRVFLLPTTAVRVVELSSRVTTAQALKIAAADMETVRNKRQEFMTMFENFDQKANQLFNIMSSVLKAMKEMESSIARNIL
jgi:hypothetical protein